MEAKNKHNTYNTLFHWHSFRLKLIFEGIAVGIFTSLLIVLYRYAIENALVLLVEIYNKALLKTQDLYSKLKLLPKEFWIIIPLLISVISL